MHGPFSARLRFAFIARWGTFEFIQYNLTLGSWDVAFTEAVLLISIGACIECRVSMDSYNSKI